MSKHYKQLIIFAISVISFVFLSSFSHTASAKTKLPQQLLRTYSSNNIYFLDADICSNPSNSSGSSFKQSNVTVGGSTAKEKVWSGLKSLGYSDEIVAGLMGSLHRESGEYNPAIYEGFISSLAGYDYENDAHQPKGVGLVQWSYDRRVKFFKFMRSHANELVDKYLMHPEKFSQANVKGDKFIELAESEEDANKMFEYEIAFIKNELEEDPEAAPTYGPLLQKTTVEDAAAFVSSVYENCGGPCQPGGSEYTNRINDAKIIYEEMTGKSFSGGSSSFNGGTSSDVCGCIKTTPSTSISASNASADEDGWLTGITGLEKDSAIGTSYVNDSAANKDFSTEMPNGKGKGPNKITLHSTEGTNGGGGSPLSFFSGFPPHFTIDLKEKKIYQHFPIYKTSAAVKSHDDTAGVQIEIIGYSDAALAKSRGHSKWILSSYTESEVSYLTELLKGISKATGIPLKSTVNWSGGSNTTHRLSSSEFKDYQGILAHRHVPDNDHWDADGIWSTLEKTLGGSTTSSNDTDSDDSDSTDSNSGSGGSSSSNSDLAGSNIENEGENVTIIGDSITNGSSSAIQAKLKNADIIAQDSKRMFGNSSGNKSGESIINELINSNQLRQIVVIALGTNDGTLSESDIQSKIIDPINKDGDHTIVFVTNYGHGRSDGQDYSGNNKVFNSLKNSNNNVIIADWASAASADPDKYINNSDGLGVHPTNPDGTELFAETIFNALSGASVYSTGYGDECSPEAGVSYTSGDVAALQATVKEFAYPTYLGRDCAQCVTKKPAYEQVIQGAKYRGDPCFGGGVDCGAFVYNAIVESGWDPNYGGGSGQTGVVQTWMRGAGASTWENVTSQIKSNADAKPGDVILSAEHVLLFVGKIEGFSSEMASASQCHRAPMADSASDISNYINQGYEVWRKK